MAAMCACNGGDVCLCNGCGVYVTVDCDFVTVCVVVYVVCVLAGLYDCVRVCECRV